MRVLFLHNNDGDYLAASLLHGLRSLLGVNCVDCPRYDCMYAPLSTRLRATLRGYGFTIYGLLKDISELADFRHWYQRELDSYDLIVIANIWNQWELVWELAPLVDNSKLVILDGQDYSYFFPYSGQLRKRPWSYFTPVSQFNYFKRELIGEGCSYQIERLIPHFFRKWIPLPKNSQQISFSIPDEKVWKADNSTRVKNFPTHIVDPEVAARVNKQVSKTVAKETYSFLSEITYYNDLRESRFGITTKRGGWDCLRHYELAANGCVLCFKNLNLKPVTCAPHGLNESNCIIYHSFDELHERISSITSSEYSILQQLTYKWIEQNTTIARAKQFLKACGFAAVNYLTNK